MNADRRQGIGHMNDQKKEVQIDEPVSYHPFVLYG